MCITCGSNRVGIPECPCLDGYYEDEDECVACDYTCITCTSATECVLCAGNRINAPDCECPANTYEDGNADCPPCSDACATCELDGSCITCTAHRSPAPLCPCESGHYETEISEVKVCEVCDIRCAECSDVYYNCETCAVDSSREGAPQCDCPNGYYDPCGANEFIYAEETGENGYGSVVISTTDRCKEAACIACDVKCATCDSAENCLTCSGLREDAPECNCPSKYYSDETETC